MTLYTILRVSWYYVMRFITCGAYASPGYQGCYILCMYAHMYYTIDYMLHGGSRNLDERKRWTLDHERMQSQSRWLYPVTQYTYVGVECHRVLLELLDPKEPTVKSCLYPRFSLALPEATRCRVRISYSPYHSFLCLFAPPPLLFAKHIWWKSREV